MKPALDRRAERHEDDGREDGCLFALVAAIVIGLTIFAGMLA